MVGEATVILPLAGVIDVEQEKARLEKELKKVESEIAKLSGKLGNEKFLAKAPAAVVAEQRERLADAEGTRDKLRDAVERLAAL